MENPLATIESANTSLEHQEASLEKIQTFNAREKINNVKKFAELGIKKVQKYSRHIINTLYSSIHKSDTNSKTVKPEELDQSTKTIPKPEPIIKSQKILEQTTEKKQSVLKELDETSVGSMKFNIHEYYKENHTNKITKRAQERLKKRDQQKKIDNPNSTENLLSEEEYQQTVTTEASKMIGVMAQKHITDFENQVDAQLKTFSFSLVDIADFWEWRKENPPQEKATLVHNSTQGIHIEHDTFVNDDAVQQFLSSREDISTPDEIFITTKEIEKRIEDSFLPANLEISPNSIDSSAVTKEQIAYDIEKSSSGWVDHKTYENVSDISAKRAIQMLGSINAELEPRDRKTLSELHYTPKKLETFGDMVEYTLDNTSDKDTQKKLSSLSRLITKLNKVATNLE